MMAMKKLILITLLLLLLPVRVSAQDNPALLLFVTGDQDNPRTVHVLKAATGEEHQITDSVDDTGWSPGGRVTPKWTTRRDSNSMMKRTKTVRKNRS